MPQLEHIEAIEKRLWSAADNLRANSNYASNEYFLPVMGLAFLRHAYSRYLTVERLRSISVKCLVFSSSASLMPAQPASPILSFGSSTEKLDRLHSHGHTIPC